MIIPPNECELGSPRSPLSHGHWQGPTVTTPVQFFSVQMQRPTHVLSLEHAPQPLNLVRRQKEWVLAEKSAMLALHDILDFPDRFARDIPHPFDMLRNKQQPMRINMPMLDKATSLFWAPAG